jgi:hypothetical protein
MRPSDYGWWTAGTAAFPGAYYLWSECRPFSSNQTHRHSGILDPSAGLKGAMRPALKVSTFLGFVGGFLLAYQKSTSKITLIANSAQCMHL